MIITGEMILRAIGLIELTAERILSCKDTTWGPKWVKGYVQVSGSGKIPFNFGIITKWNPAWGVKKYFDHIAEKKMELAKRMNSNTSDIVAICPWQLQQGEFLYPGGVSRFGISVGVSGAKGHVDEAIANLMVDTIIMLAHLEAEKRKEEKRMEIKEF